MYQLNLKVAYSYIFSSAAVRAVIFESIMLIFTNDQKISGCFMIELLTECF